MRFREGWGIVGERVRANNEMERVKYSIFSKTTERVRRNKRLRGKE